jgi:hypothetical protein
LFASVRRILGSVLSLVAHGLSLAMQRFGRDHLLVAPPQQRDLFAPSTDQSAKLGSRNLESA